MTADNIKEFLYCLRVPKKSIRETKDFINSKCPLAFFSHKRGEDYHPSFGIKISENRSYYYCFTCSPYPQRLHTLVHNYWLMYGEYPFEAAKVLITENTDCIVTERKDQWEEIKKDPEPLVKYVTNQFPQIRYEKEGKAIQVKRYLESRGIPEWVYNYCGVRYDPRWGSLIFSLTDCQGRIFLLRARGITRKVNWTISSELLNLDYSFPRLTDVGVFFNSHLIDRSKPVMVVEGPIDCMRLISLGYFNCIASATSAITQEQINAINSGVVILGMDNDRSGKKGNYRIMKSLREKSIMYVADWGIAGKKDAGELKNRKELSLILNNLKSIS
jgi:5S rRNA maturation endonuclease (ribonuclease M5)